MPRKCNVPALRSVNRLRIFRQAFLLRISARSRKPEKCQGCHGTMTLWKKGSEKGAAELTSVPRGRCAHTCFEGRDEFPDLFLQFHSTEFLKQFYQGTAHHHAVPERSYGAGLGGV